MLKKFQIALLHTLFLFAFTGKLSAQDFRATAYTLEDTIAGPGSKMIFFATIQNTGFSTSYFRTGYAISTDTIWDQNDKFLDYSEDNSIPKNGILSKTISFKITQDITPGKYYLLVFPDYDKRITESSETNNIGYASFKVFQPFTEIHHLSAALSNTIQSGSYFSVRSLIRNTGSVASGASKIHYFLSTDSIPGDTDFSLGSIDVNEIPAQTSQQIEPMLRLPAVETRDYYLVSVSDYEKQITELIENNNVRFEKIKVVKPTDSIHAPYYNTLAITTCKGKVYRAGNTDETYNSNGGYLTIYPEKPGDFVNLKIKSGSGSSVEVYDGISINSFLIGSFNTDSSAIYSSKGYGAITIKIKNPADNFELSVGCQTKPGLPDFIISEFKVSPSAIPAGKSFTVSNTIKNDGLRATEISGVNNYFLSKDTIWNAEDLEVGYLEVKPLAISESIISEKTIYISDTILPGAYYLIQVADFVNNIKEINENNNIAWRKVAIGNPTYDFYIPQFEVKQKYIAPGEKSEIFTFILNSGKLTIEPDVEIYLSSDPNVDGGDRLLAKVNNLNENISEITIPADIIEGNYFLIALVDGNNEVAEINEENNKALQYIKVKNANIDLVVENPFQYSILGDSTYSSAYLVNLGNIPSDSTQMDYYLSPDRVWDKSDIFLASSEKRPAGRDKVFVGAKYKLPANLKEGRYFVIFFADSKNLIAESNEANNTDYIEIQYEKPSQIVMPAAGTMEITTCSADLYANKNSEGTLIIHPGNPNTFVNITFGSDLDLNDVVEIYDGTSTSDVLLKKFTYKNKPAAVTATNPTGALTIVYKIGLPFADRFKVHVKCVKEVKPDLSVGLANLYPAEFAPGDQTMLQCFLVNNGAVDANDMTISLYLSEDTVLSKSDVLVFAKAFGYYQYGVTIPDSIVPGDYYALFVADAENKMEELNENNNLRYKKVRVSVADRDLSVSGLNVSSTEVLPAQEIKVSSWIYNSGTKTIKASQLKIYLSSDNFADTNDIVLNTLDIDSLKAGHVSQINALVKLPQDLAGKYYLILAADAGKNITETNELNNISSLQVTISVTTLQNPENTAGIRIYPNPSSGHVTISVKPELMQMGNVELIICDMQGTQVSKHTEDKNIQELDLNLPAGIYSVTLKSGEATTFDKFVIIR